MMTMKRFFGLATLLSVMLAFFSCEPAESGYEFEYFYDNISKTYITYRQEWEAKHVR